MPATIVSTQLKFSVPPAMYAKLKSRAKNAGVQVTSYVRHLLIAGLENTKMIAPDMTDEEFGKYLDTRPTFRASERVEQSYLQVMKEVQQGKATTLHDSGEVEEYFADIKARALKKKKK